MAKPGAAGARRASAGRSGGGAAGGVRELLRAAVEGRSVARRGPVAGIGGALRQQLSVVPAPGGGKPEPARKARRRDEKGSDRDRTVDAPKHAAPVAGSAGDG